ncbi:putative alkaline shock family protein YloU [Paenibacillus sp. V4I3]|uniref:Asp23/Gls24 family envelope stress response protein n=1 Tax=Paenibacillus alginolyticus TaxID=59839 RepID=A0ABT4GK19_9BACL|nr:MULTISPECIES: Asp23/Gls24 family envelope stress response protein [Paenibacillus]KQX46470.1 alkaline-shock protein [Paenibacillus sp. Root444D2]KRE33343.1 alkaline-shock protein [Paenibacillus sp. Soil724D2]MCY9696545.1 Asp23/Gls24 family envelope stress response protein [Paenibacillus alginolyticus]MDQ0874974.1 putative alkaline shock family protein YloU [Paenibacillus sp. V4I3]MDQ0889275.1 putative alkaline shock family protein YloU [Paenibacillus sp. V4I9]
MSTIAPDYVKTDMGSIQIAPEVIEIIAGLATVEVQGVAGMSGGLAGGIAELLGRKNLSKGVKVEVGQREAAIDVSIIIEYGNRIPEVASDIQQNVKQAIESMTGLNVVEVNVHIHDVHFKQVDKPVEEETAAAHRVK